MRQLGWAFLAGYALDAGLSVVSSFAPDVLLVSNAVSTVMILFTVVALVLACWGKLNPRKTFLVLSGFYFLMLGFGFAVGVLLVVQLGPQNVQGPEGNPAFLRQQFPWFGPVHWTLLVLWLCFAGYGLVSYAAYETGVNHGDATNVE
jgi:hypothetical protein